MINQIRYYEPDEDAEPDDSEVWGDENDEVWGHCFCGSPLMYEDSICPGCGMPIDDHEDADA